MTKVKRWEPYLIPHEARQEPYEFRHNEYLRGTYYAWECVDCGLVKLEYEKAIEIWMCEICLFKLNMLNKR